MMMSSELVRIIHEERLSAARAEQLARLAQRARRERDVAAADHEDQGSFRRNLGRPAGGLVRPRL